MDLIRPVCLYISYDGLMEPLGQSQILPYLRGLAQSGIRFVLLTFEKPTDLGRHADVATLRRELAADGIRWIPLRYHKRPSLPATLWDVARGLLTGMWLARRTGAQIVHCRSYVAGLIGAAVRAASRAKLIFDMRGFWPEERVDGGIWCASSVIFRLAKRVEILLFRASDAVIVLTERARMVLAADPYRAWLPPDVPVTVIPCCVDLRRFDPSPPGPGGPPRPGPRTLVYAGSVGTWYMLGEMLDFFAAARERQPDLAFLILNRGEHDVIRRAVRDRRLDGVTVIAATPAEVAEHLSRAYVGMYFIKPVFSKTGASPTKLGEYLAAGLPVIVNAGVGDADQLVTAARVGVVVERFTGEEYVEKWRALEHLLGSDDQVRVRCRETARRELALEHGVARYRRVYEALIGGSSASSASRAGTASMAPTRPAP